ncbi:hypothetical protein CCP2SC5_300029 [Azospirillaceae bacterium]
MNKKPHEAEMTFSVEKNGALSILHKKTRKHSMTDVPSRSGQERKPSMIPDDQRDGQGNARKCKEKARAPPHMR